MRPAGAKATAKTADSVATGEYRRREHTAAGKGPKHSTPVRYPGFAREYMNWRTHVQTDAAEVGERLASAFNGVSTPRFHRVDFVRMTPACRAVTRRREKVLGDGLPRVLVLFSGGIESTVIAHQYHRANHEVHLLALDYGQRHRKEHEYAASTASRLGVPFREADVRDIGSLLPGNSLTDADVPVPVHRGPETERNFVVPNRNVILLSIAFAAAVPMRADQLAIGATAGDAGTTGDCSQTFVDAFNAMERVATADCAPEHLSVVAPLMGLQKYEVIQRGESLGISWGETWSCFKDGEKQCGTCATCYDRRTAFQKAGVPDPTLYTET